MRRQLFRSTSLRLAGTYLVVLMTLSIVFSMVIYRLSSNEFNHNYDQARGFANQFIGFRFDPQARDDYLAGRMFERDEGKSRIVNRLVLLNLFIVCLGGGVCYYFARRTLEPIEEAHDSLERFTSDAAHELRTPLTSMRTEIEVALMKDKLTTAEAAELLKSNLEEVIRLSALSDRLLGLARGDSGVLEKKPVQVATILQRAQDAVSQRATAKKIVIELGSVPQNASKVVADEASLTEVLIILLDNAIKYSSAKTHIKLTARRALDHVQLAVADQGAGIPTEEIPHIFERFYRHSASRTKDATHGYGLGLPLAKKIIEEHDGSIKVKSTLGKGSTFTIILPRA